MPTRENKKNIAVLLFHDYETLDVFGPVEIFGRLSDHYSIKFYSQTGGLIHNKHSVSIMTEKLDEIKNKTDILLIPGGIGTRKEVENASFVHRIKQLAKQSEFVLSVCTGSALLARTGLLDGKQATSNKRAFEWAKSNGAKVNWNPYARWCIDGKYYTSSGVSAGMDMSLDFLKERHGLEFAKKVATEIEYHWNEDKNEDSFKAQ